VLSQGLQGSCDVAVIGDGLTGCSAALAPLMGTITAEVMDGRTECNPWRLRLAGHSRHLGPRFLSLIGTYYRIKDRFQ
jgi:hypothetical protein